MYTSNTKYKNRSGITYSFSKLDDNTYQFNMSKSIAFWRFGKKDGKFNFFDPPSGPFVCVGTLIDDKKIASIAVEDDKSILLKTE